ncbi:21189_t:CDS:2, partial [Gigaspora rosea]
LYSVRVLVAGTNIHSQSDPLSPGCYYNVIGVKRDTRVICLMKGVLVSGTDYSPLN